MRIVVLLPFLLALSSPVATVEIRGMKHPALSPDGQSIAFSYHGDIWTVPSEGGVARRITDREGDEWKPAWSPDGKQIAYSADWYGNRDIWIHTLETGHRRRLTWHSQNDDKPAWSPDGKWIAFHSDRDSNLDLPMKDDVFDIWKMPADGGTATRVTRFRGMNPAWSSDGKHIAFDRYASGYSDGEHDIWVIDPSGGEAPTALVKGSEDSRNPVFAGRSVYFAHEANGIRLVRQRNVWRARLGGGPVFQVTRLSGDHVTWPSASEDGSLLVFEYDFHLHVQRKKGLQTRTEKLEIRIDKETYPKEKKKRTLTSGAGAPRWSPDGSKIALILENDLWVLDAEGKNAKQLTRTLDDERDPSWSKDGDSLLFVRSPWGGAGHVCSVPAEGGDVKTLTKEKGFYGAPAFSPDGTRIVFQEKDGVEVDLMIADVKSGAKRPLVAEKNAHETDGRFSPDGSKVAYLLLRSDGGMVRSDVVVMPLNGEKARVHTTDNTIKQGLDWSSDGQQLVYAARSIRSSRTNIQFLDVKADKTSSLPSTRRYARMSPSLSPDGTMLLVSEGRVRGRTVSSPRLRVYDLEENGESVTLEFEVEKEFTLRDENLALFLEVWGLFNQFYYDEHFHGADWPAIRETYAPLAAECRTRPELHEIINDMIRELQSSHVALHPSGPINSVVTGMLGADLTRLEDGRLKVSRVVRNGPADEGGLKDGSVIISVGEHKLDANTNFDRLMTRDIAKKPTEIPLAVQNAEGDIRTHYVMPISRTDLRELKYANQIIDRKKFVREKSKGRLAFAHIRYMSANEVTRVRKEVETEFPEAKGLVLDIRDGVGGMAHRETITWLDSTAADRINRKPLLYMRNRNGWTGPDRYPTRRRIPHWDKPVILIQNHISRSDKEILPYSFRKAGLGYTVGEPTARGVIGGNNRAVRDGSKVTVSVQGWFTADGRNMEAWGVPPDFLVRETHADLYRGRDRQLEKAVEVLLAQMDGRISAPDKGDPAEEGK